MKKMLMTTLTTLLFLTAIAAEAGTLSCQNGDGEKMTLIGGENAYHLRFEETNFHFDTLVSKFGFPVDNGRYQIDVAFDATYCRSNKGYSHLIDCGTSVPSEQLITIRNLQTGQVHTKELSQLGQFRSTRQRTESLFSDDEVRTENLLVVDFVGYSKEFPFVSGGIGRTFRFGFSSCSTK